MATRKASSPGTTPSSCNPEWSDIYGNGIGHGEDKDRRRGVRHAHMWLAAGRPGEPDHSIGRSLRHRAVRLSRLRCGWTVARNPLGRAEESPAGDRPVRGGPERAGAVRGNATVLASDLGWKGRSGSGRTRSRRRGLGCDGRLDQRQVDRRRDVRRRRRRDVVILVPADHLQGDRRRRGSRRRLPQDALGASAFRPDRAPTSQPARAHGVSVSTAERSHPFRQAGPGRNRRCRRRERPS